MKLNLNGVIEKSMTGRQDTELNHLIYFVFLEGLFDIGDLTI